MAVKRKRPYVAAVQLNAQEKQELKAAANRAGLALSVFLRASALALVRGKQLGPAA